MNDKPPAIDEQLVEERVTYHHGELRAEIMRLALQHIEAEGTERLSLRALAREAGVSQAAPYRHFPNKHSLFAALATDGFNKLSRNITAIVDSPLPIARRFIDMGVAYIEFALANPTSYHLMFGSVLGDFSEHEELRVAATQCYAQVRRCEKELLEMNQHSYHPDRLGGVIWAGVHGIASLLLHRGGLTKVEPVTNSPMVSVTAMRNDIEDSVKILFEHLTQSP